MKTEHGIDWNNVKLKDGYERDLYMLDSYDFDTLLLEINCNLIEINADTVRAQFEESLNSKIEVAKSIFNSNLDNIVKQALKERMEK